MDAHLETEVVDASGRWSMTSKVLSGLIVVVAGFLLVSMFSIAIDFNTGWTERQVGGVSAGNLEGSFNTEKPVGGSGSSDQEEMDIGSASQDTQRESVSDDSGSEQVEESVVQDAEDSVDSFEIVEDANNIDPAILSDAQGCLERTVTGDVCNQVFTRDDIADYCGEFGFNDETLKFADPCFAIAAAMNNNKDLCYDVENEALLNKCLERFQ